MNHRPELSLPYSVQTSALVFVVLIAPVNVGNRVGVASIYDVTILTVLVAVLILAYALNANDCAVFRNDQLAVERADCAAGSPSTGLRWQ